MHQKQLLTFVQCHYIIHIYHVNPLLLLYKHWEITFHCQTVCIFKRLILRVVVHFAVITKIQVYSPFLLTTTPLLKMRSQCLLKEFTCRHKVLQFY